MHLGVRDALRANRTNADAVDPLVEATRASTYPPPYPEGWYVVARSADLAAGPRFVQCADHHWVVFRDAAGEPRVLDAYCPHLGANLADGRVRGDTLECPFHGWRIDGEGRVVAQSEPAEIAPRCRTRSWCAEDLHGLVVAFHRHDAEEPGAAPAPPYRLQRLHAIDDGQLVFRGDYDAGRVRMHLAEFAENSADFRHFAAIHGRLRIPWTSIPVPGWTIRHRATWRRDENEPHVCWFGDDAVLAFRGRMIEGSGARAQVRFDGPGGVIRFDFRLDHGGGRVVMFQCHTPVGPLVQEVRFRWFSEPRVPRAVASFVVGNWVSQWREDIRIWERKIYRRHPTLSRADGPVHQLRRWYAQFYPSAP